MDQHQALRPRRLWLSFWLVEHMCEYAYFCQSQPDMHDWQTPDSIVPFVYQGINVKLFGTIKLGEVF